MATATIEGYLYASTNGLGYQFFCSDTMFAYGYVLVRPHTITVEVPDDIDLTAGRIAELERKRAAAMDAAAKAEKEMEQLRQVSSKTE